MSRSLARALRFVFVLFACLSQTAHARAEAAPSSGSPARELRYDLWVDVPVIVGNLAFSAAVIASEPGPSRCRWCERSNLNAVDEFFRDAARDPDSGSAKTLGRVTALLLPASVLGLNAYGAFDQGRGWPTLGVDLLVVTEAMSIALSLSSLAKLTVGRQRPHALDLPESEIDGVDRPADENASFFSGHTAMSFSLAVASGTVASMRGYRYAPVVWATGLTLATLVAYPRIVADEHYFTDVLAGGVVGAGVGFAVPYFFHGPRPLALSTASVPGGRLLLISGEL